VTPDKDVSIGDVIRQFSNRPAAQTESAGDSPSSPVSASPTQVQHAEELAADVAELEDQLRAVSSELHRELKEKRAELRDIMLDLELDEVFVAGRRPTTLKPSKKKDVTKKAITAAMGDKDAADELWKKLPIKETYYPSTGDVIEPE